jgi:hypothetical protein
MKGHHAPNYASPTQPAAHAVEVPHRALGESAMAQ